ncbi:uncharacterized protein [Rutidosis leptorrhynchoides]|uniref:uncharacterized protein n=1 Tax=Rutidosis leptorrhynchoides TaxID=125765 RepID=UPI003A992A41
MICYDSMRLMRKFMVFQECSELRSIDCMHWAWGKLPVAWKGQFIRNDHKVLTIMLEAVAKYDNWICHAFFGVAGSNNNLNVLNDSNLFNSMLNEEIEDIHFTANGVEYKKRYYLSDEIYPGGHHLLRRFQVQMMKNVLFEETSRGR